MEMDSLAKKLMTPINIYQKLDYIANHLEEVNKDIEVQSDKKTYKVASEQQIIKAVRPLEHEVGIYSYPAKVEIIGTGCEKIKGSSGVYNSYWTKIKLTYRFVNVDHPEEFIDVQTIGTGIDLLDKEGGKALTYATKYALSKAYKMMFSEDPDNVESKKQYPQSENEVESNKHPTQAKKSPQSPKNANGEVIMTDKQKKFIEQLKDLKAYSDILILENYGYTLSDPDIPVGVANEIINYLKSCPNKQPSLNFNAQPEIDDDDLPF